VDDLAHRKAADIQRLGIELLLDHRIEKIDPNVHRVIALRPDGQVSEYSYDKLVVGTGASSVRPPIGGLDLPGVFLLRWIGDTLAFEHYLAMRLPQHVVIVGGGYIGLEMSEALTHRGIRVTIIEMAPSVMTTIDPDLGLKVGHELQRHGVRVVTGQPISSISADGETSRRARTSKPCGALKRTVDDERALRNVEPRAFVSTHLAERLQPRKMCWNSPTDPSWPLVLQPIKSAASAYIDHCVEGVF
jgi:NADPH-dependent 2,4-dienoyl-CoA reductase/sulfur reductase-like enzyme